jgi:hypothetical protein
MCSFDNSKLGLLIDMLSGEMNNRAVILTEHYPMVIFFFPYLFENSYFLLFFAVLRILIFTHPGSRISDPKTSTKERGEKNFCQTFFCSYKFHKIVNHFIFEIMKKKIWANFQRIIELFTQKIVTKFSKI